MIKKFENFMDDDNEVYYEEFDESEFLSKKDFRQFKRVEMDYISNHIKFEHRFVDSSLDDVGSRSNKLVISKDGYEFDYWVNKYMNTESILFVHIDDDNWVYMVGDGEYISDVIRFETLEDFCNYFNNHVNKNVIKVKTKGIRPRF